MPSLDQLIGTQSDPTITQQLTNNPVVEPLDGPSTVDDVMDRFPEEVYQQGRDTHLYRLLTALGGDSGAGLIKAQAFAARLQTEAEFLNFQVLDQFYAAQFSFHRLADETYPGLDPNNDALTPDEWDQIQLADQSYKQRVMEFFTAIRFGNTPEGMAYCAQAGCGVECEIVENYKYIYDTLSDNILGLAPKGTTVSTQEFIVIPRFVGDEIEAPNLEFQQSVYRTYTFTAPTGSAGPTVTRGYSYTPVSITKMIPGVERNVEELFDRLRPTDTISTVSPEQVRFVEITPNLVAASSERVVSSRLVTGSANVNWPATDPGQNYFIQAGVENEQGSLFGASYDLPTIFLTIENIHAYTDQALLDPTYGTNSFYDIVQGVSPATRYESVEGGAFEVVLQAIFPFLANLASDATFIAQNAISSINTPLVMQGRQVVT